MAVPRATPDLASLELLHGVAQHGSIRQAASAFGISQPAASSRLQSLERTLGLDLLDRSSGTARLTPAGMAVVQWSEGILDATRTLLAGTDALRIEGRTKLRLAASMTVAEYLMPQWLVRLRALEPELRVSLDMENSSRVVELVREKKVDLGFVEGRSPLSGLQHRVIARDELVLLVAPEHPWSRRRKPLSVDELAPIALVVRERGSGTREVLANAFARKGYELTALVELGSTTAIKRAVAQGTGPAVLSRLSVRDDLREGRLIEVATSGLDFSRSITAVWLRSIPLSEAARNLVSLAAGASSSDVP
jgi:molybdate transport repressor ModE-like protein